MVSEFYTMIKRILQKRRNKVLAGGMPSETNRNFWYRCRNQILRENPELVGILEKVVSGNFRKVI